MILIKKGRGILIPVFWIMGALLGTFFGEVLRLCVRLPVPPGVFAGRCLFIGGALASWLCALTTCKSEVIHTIDPKTRHHTIEVDRHTLYFIPAMGWAILMSCVAIVIVLRPPVQKESGDNSINLQQSDLGVEVIVDPSAISSEPSMPTPMRNWTDVNGRPLKAALLRFVTDAKDVAEFRREDGQQFEIPIGRFSPDDQAYLKRLAITQQSTKSSD